jgi:hypothetical protein
MESELPIPGGAIGNADVMTNALPCATYRIQFNLNFRSIDAEELVPYLHALGVTRVYASPRFRFLAELLSPRRAINGRTW